MLSILTNLLLSFDLEEIPIGGTDDPFPVPANKELVYKHRVSELRFLVDDLDDHAPQRYLREGCLFEDHQQKMII